MPCIPRRYGCRRLVEPASVHLLAPERAVAWRYPHLRHWPDRSGSHCGPVARPATCGELAVTASDAHPYRVRGNYGLLAHVRVASGEIENDGASRSVTAAWTPGWSTTVNVDSCQHGRNQMGSALKTRTSYGCAGASQQRRYGHATIPGSRMMTALLDSPRLAAGAGTGRAVAPL